MEQQVHLMTVSGTAVQQTHLSMLLAISTSDGPALVMLALRWQALASRALSRAPMRSCSVFRSCCASSSG